MQIIKLLRDWWRERKRRRREFDIGRYSMINLRGTKAWPPEDR
jgi:hypothetical protein